MQSEEIFSEIAKPENNKWIKDIVSKMEPDLANGPILMNLLDNNQPETRGFVAWAAKRLQPKNYLEIGTRRGWSVAMVAMASPNTELYCCDQWDPDYSSSPNPGAGFVVNELKKLSFDKPINFLNGDSRKLIPQLFQDNPGLLFDLILVDGDHSVDGALIDLHNTMPNVSVGGMLVFDDIVGVARLDEVFYGLKDTYPNFEYHAFTRNYPGVGLAIRTS